MVWQRIRLMVHKRLVCVAPIAKRLPASERRLAIKWSGLGDQKSLVMKLSQLAALGEASTKCMARAKNTNLAWGGISLLEQHVSFRYQLFFTTAWCVPYVTPPKPGFHILCRETHTTHTKRGEVWIDSQDFWTPINQWLALEHKNTFTQIKMKKLKTKKKIKIKNYYLF